MKVLTEYVFDCSGCGESVAVNAEMKQTLLRDGCPVCRGEVSEDDFDSV